MQGVQEATSSKVTPLSRDLGVSRRRLKRFIDGDLKVDKLTVGEYRVLSGHPIFKDMMAQKLRFPNDDLGVLNGGGDRKGKQFLASYRVKFFPDKIKRGLDLYATYIHEANLSINCVTGQPFGDSTYHLMALLQVGDLAHDDLIGFNQYATHWDIRIAPEDQKKWFSVAMEKAGGESNFQKIWQEFNELIDGVHTFFFSLRAIEGGMTTAQLNFGYT